MQTSDPKEYLSQPPYTKGKFYLNTPLYSHNPSFELQKNYKFAIELFRLNYSSTSSIQHSQLSSSKKTWEEEERVCRRRQWKGQRFGEVGGGGVVGEELTRPLLCLLPPPLIPSPLPPHHPSSLLVSLFRLLYFSPLLSLFPSSPLSLSLNLF